MAENSENIEARLCAYVEGDLDEAGRVEIERHLEAHPNHRRLLAELAVTRDLVRTLPREPAPPELSETFNAHLERASLLDGPGPDSGNASLRLNVLPRLMGLAAILVLTVGLVALVYWALPRGDSGTQLAMPTTRSADRTSSAELALATPDGAASSGPAYAARPPDALGKWGPSPSAGVVESGKDGSPAHAGIVADADDGAAGRRALRPGTPGTPDNPVYVIVSAADLPNALREVTDNLTGFAVQWEPAGEPAASHTNQARDKQLSIAAAGGASSYAQVELKNALKKKQSPAYQQQYQFRQQQQAAQVRRPSRGGGNDEDLEFARAAGQSALNAATQDARVMGRVAKGGAPSEVSEQQRPPQPQEQVAATDAAPSQEPAAGAAPGSELASAESESRAKDDHLGPNPTRSNAVEPSPLAEQVARGQGAADASNGPADASAVSSTEQRQALAGRSEQQQQQQRDGVGTPAAKREDGQWAEADVPADAEVTAINAYAMTPTQVLALSRSLNRADQRVELIADDERLQLANDVLQQDWNRPAATPSSVLADAATHAGETPADGVGITSPGESPAPSPATPPSAAPAGRQEVADAARPTRQSPVAMKSGPAPTTRPAAVAGVAPAAAPAAGRARETAAATAPRAAAPQVAGKPGPSSPGPSSPGMSMRHGSGRPTGFRAGAKLKVTVDELAGPDSGSTAAAQVADDGTIRLPRLPEPLHVEGLTRVQAERAIADAYKAAGVIDAATVSVDTVDASLAGGGGGGGGGGQVAKAGPAPQRVTGTTAAQRQQLGGAAANVPPERLPAAPPDAANIAADAAAATTAPLTSGAAQPAQQQAPAAANAPPSQAAGSGFGGASSQPADDRLHVVILVQRPASASPASPLPANSPPARPESAEPTTADDAGAAPADANPDRAATPADAPSPSQPPAPAD